MKIFKRIAWIIGIIVVLFLGYLLGMIGYAMSTDYDPPTETTVDISGSASKDTIPDTLTFLNWNIGFAGLGEESDFFYDGGKKVHMPESIVKKNLKGITKTIQYQADSTDFFLLQEVDLSARRSYHQNEIEHISGVLPGYTQSFGKNYDVNFIPIPLTNPLGDVISGVASWSRFAPISATRHSFEGNYDWPTYLFFLDRCFLVKRFALANGKELLVINTHNSAYDDGTLKKKQMEQMQALLLSAYQAGNFVIVGGDWNQYPPDYQGVSGHEVSRTEENQNLFVSSTYPEPGWTWAYDPTVATNRSLSAAFDPETTSQYIIDYFLLSPNIELLEVRNIDLGFQYSDHQPVRLKVRLAQ